jgi:undecaprenyl-diphosphatase
MACARVYIAAHYPWDVAAGLAFGAACTWVVWFLLRGPLTTLTQSLRQQPPLRLAFTPAAPVQLAPEPVATASRGEQR